MKEESQIFIQEDDQKRAQTVGLTELMRSQVLTMVQNHFNDLSKKYKTAFMDGFHMGMKMKEKQDEYEDE